MRRQKHLVIVYQFGKVASTSLVNALNSCAGVEAHQSHFLGNDALQRIIPNATNADTNDYFRAHIVGQLAKNIELTHRINRAFAGDDAARLVVVSLARDPLDWLRSCIQQDILGYRDDVLAYSVLKGAASGASVRHGLTAVLADVTAILGEFGGADAAIEGLQIGTTKMALKTRDDLQHPFLRRMFLLALRPLTWFDDHFAECFSLSLSQFQRHETYWLAKRQGARFALLRYEDIDHAVAPAMKTLGVPFPKRGLKMRNASKNKPFAADIQAAFAGDVPDELRALLLRSAYARHFGYCAPELADQPAPVFSNSATI